MNIRIRPTVAPTHSGDTILVGLDNFGNAIPAPGIERGFEVASYLEIPLRPARASLPVVSRPPSVGLARVWEKLGQWRRMAAPSGRRIDSAPVVHEIEERLEHAFHRLHQEFNQREQRLEEKMQAVLKHQPQQLAGTQRKKTWLAPLVWVAAGLGGAYMLYLLTGMQQSMTHMSGNMNAMAGDTRHMSAQMQSMNGAMTNMNQNVASMSNNMAQMNQNVGGMARAVEPMGQAAATASPFMRMFRSFMPF